VDEVTRGLGSNYQEAVFDCLSPWWKPTTRRDKRLQPAIEGNPVKSAGRRMTHPFLEDLVYSRIPDQTINMAADTLPRAETVVTRTLDGSAVARYDDFLDDIIVREIWLAQSASTITDMWRHLHRYWMAKLPPDRFIGWQPRDLTPKRYAIEILRVYCGPADGEFLIESIGREPGLMRQQLSVTFRTIREVASPSGILLAGGA
jgi:hypothetical protein